MSNKKSEENSDPFLLRAVSLSFSLSADESDESAEDKWRIMRTRSEQRADHVGDWNAGGRRAEDGGDYSDGRRRNPRRRDERRETAKLNGCDPSRACGRGESRERASTQETSPDVCA